MERFDETVEVDGDIHEGQAAADRERDRALEEKGFLVLRFRNHEIEQELNNILSKILAACNQTLPNHPNSPPLQGEGPGERSRGA